MSENIQSIDALAKSANAKVIPVVSAQGSEAMADSRDVAAYFDKDHKRVLQTIREMKCSDDFRRHNFVPFKIKDLSGESTSHVTMTKNGFIFLAMGFTGDKAAKFKESYIAAFDVMEAELRTKPTINLNDPAFLRSALLTYTEKVIALESHVAILTPKADALDRIATADGSLGLIEAAKALQIQPKAFVRYLSMNGWIYRRAGGKSWLGYQVRTASGDIEHKVHAQQTEDGSQVMHEQVKITPRGLTKLAKIIPHSGANQGAIQ